MIPKGLIVSIQKYSAYVTQELSLIAEGNGAVAIRTDQPINIVSPKIGLIKIPEKEFYITTTKEAINQVNKWADYVAIDSRKGNKDLSFLFAFCHQNGIKVVADIEKIEDFENIIEICEKGKIAMPKAIATTFSNTNNDLIKQIKELRDITVIAEGGYSNEYDVMIALTNGADNICIGTAISDIGKLTKKYREQINGYEGN